MVNMVQTYVIHDSDEAVRSKQGAIRINRNEAQAWNEKGYGIFQTVQSFDDAGRKIERLVGVNAWAIDMDGGNKPDQMARIEKGLPPTQIVETKNGYQVYWACADTSLAVLKETFRQVMRNRLVPFYGADRRAWDLARVLRVPGFFHLKDPRDPFLVKRVHFEPVTYKLEDMITFYKDVVAEEEAKKEFRKLSREGFEGKGFFERLGACDQSELLTRLSGIPEVRGEVFTFRQNGNGKQNILVNGGKTSTFIDQEGRIGSLDGGGPTVYQWLLWYGIEKKRAIEIIKQIAPELEDTQEKLL
jgi:hypothetical protein